MSTSDDSDVQGFDEDEGVVVSADAGTVASADPGAALDEADAELAEERGAPDEPGGE